MRKKHRTGQREKHRRGDRGREAKGKAQSGDIEKETEVKTERWR